MRGIFTLLILFAVIACQPQQYDLIIKNGTIVDGSGQSGYQADLAVNGDKIVCIAPGITNPAKSEIDASGKIVSPGFIDMLSWACGPIVYDGQVGSVVQQGITTAIFGEGWSMGPVNDSVLAEMKHWWPEYNIEYDWKTLNGYLDFIEQKGSSVNIASYVGATTLRMYVVGFADRQATPDELEEMKSLLRQEMEGGALGLASSLVYTPAFYADTHELVELAKVAAEYDGVYASHLRGEGSDLIKALNEFISICEQANISGEIYHLKAAGKENAHLLDEAISIIEKARQRGLEISADVYPYTAGATGLDAMMPPWAKEGGKMELVRRLKNKAERSRIKNEILHSFSGWENFYWMSAGGQNILLSYLSEKNKKHQGKTLAQYAVDNNKEVLEALFDLLIEEDGAGGGIFFFMEEENVQKKIQIPWVSFCTDEDAYRPEGLMSRRNPHPRAYGTFPRILGHYVREKQVIMLEEAIRKMTSLPAQKMGFTDRGLLKENMAADIVIFDPKMVADRASYTRPHRYPTGIEAVVVNGRIVVEKGIHTKEAPGKVLRKNIRKDKN